MKSGMKNRKMILNRILPFLLVFTVLLSGVPMTAVKAANRTLSMQTAKSMALAQSADYTKLMNKLALAKVQYAQAVKSIKLKEKNQKTFRWSPLLNFKFPEKPDITDEFEYTYKPTELQSQIDTLNHSISDCVYGIYEKVCLSFIETYVLQERITYNESRLTAYETTLNRNRIRLYIGLANQTDIDELVKKVETIKTTLAADKRSYESKKEKLGELIGIDVSTSYDFTTPFLEAELDRDILDELIAYTLDHDDAYYQAKVATSNGLLQLNTNYQLMKSQYGNKMRIIDSFINQAKRGEKLDAAAFKLKYGELLTDVDNPWNGKKRILFIRIPKEWFKGAIDGIRYVEDEPYILYESAVEYQGLYADEQAMKKELTNSVKDYYANCIASQNSCDELEKTLAKKSAELVKSKILNGMGAMTYEEYSAVQEEYESLQMDLLEAKSAYSQIICSFDRLTCGALSNYLTGSSIDMSATEGGESFVVEDQSSGVYYFIRSMVENNIFELGLSVPDEFDVSISDFELWVDGIMVGKRTSIDSTIRHLSLDLNDVERVFIRLYDGENFVDDCDIDPYVYSDKLTITGYSIESNENPEIGTYSVETNSVTKMLELTVTPQPGLNVASYNIKAQNGKYLISNRKIPIKEKFRYPVLTEESLKELTLYLYDEAGMQIFEAQFDREEQTLVKKGE